MSKSRTTDERYILSLYEEAKKANDISTEFNKYEIGRRAHINPKGVDAISKLLIQANFIKKGEEPDSVYMTAHGEKLALRLLDEKLG